MGEATQRVGNAAGQAVGQVAQTANQAVGQVSEQTGRLLEETVNEAGQTGHFDGKTLSTPRRTGGGGATIEEAS